MLLQGRPCRTSMAWVGWRKWAKRTGGRCLAFGAGHHILRRGCMQLRTSARVFGAVLILWGIAGEVGLRGQEHLGDAALYVICGAILLYAGCARSLSSGGSRSMIFGIGLLNLVVGGLAPGGLLLVLGESLGSVDLREVLVRVAVGALCVLCASLLPCKDDPPGEGGGGRRSRR
jgi:hypothetical protein